MAQGSSLGQLKKAHNPPLASRSPKRAYHTKGGRPPPERWRCPPSAHSLPARTECRVAPPFGQGPRVGGTVRMGGCYIFPFALLHADTSDCLLPFLPHPFTRLLYFYDLILLTRSHLAAFCPVRYTSSVAIRSPMYDTHL